MPVTTMPLHRLRALADPRAHAALVGGFSREVRAIRRMICSRDISLVVVTGLVNPHAAIAARQEGVPVVWQLLDTRPPPLLRRLCMPLVRGLADVVMTTGRAVADVHPGTPADRLVPFAPPVDTVLFRPDRARRAAARTTLGVPSDALLVGTVGNINPQKGHETLLAAAEMVSARFPSLHIRILGASTPTQEAYAVRIAAAARGVARAALIDPGGDVHELLPGFDVFALASVSRSEGLPTAILEAMACGLPVVASDVGAVREAVGDGATGFVVPPGDVSALAAALARLLGDAGRRAAFGTEARRRAVECFDVERCAQTHLAAFSRALARNQSRWIA